MTKPKFLALNIFSHSIQEGENILGIILIFTGYKAIQEDSDSMIQETTFPKEIQGEWEPSPAKIWRTFPFVTFKHKRGRLMPENSLIAMENL